MKPILQALLGSDKATALDNALSSRPELVDVVGSRVVLAWVRQLHTFDSVVPGSEVHLNLAKSEHGLNGHVQCGLYQVRFESAEPEYVTAALMHSLGQSLRKAEIPIESYLRFCQVVDSWLAKKTLDPQAGYKISHTHTPFKDGNLYHVDVHSPDGSHVANAKFWHTKNSLTPVSVVVDDDHQRKGIASAMYSHAEKVSNAKVQPSENQTPEGAALWSGNAQTKQFGKTELPGGAAVPKPAEEAIKPEAASRKPKLPKISRKIPSAKPNPVQEVPKAAQPPKNIPNT